MNFATSYTSTFSLTLRGFTGHEHYPEFCIINMNGRLYDPVIGRFFSPDNFVQLPEFTQSYNRYSYCLNNSLKYTDPSGELITKFLDKEGNVLLDVNDGSNAVFQLTGTNQTKDYFKFAGWSDQGGINQISMQGLIAGAQDYVMNYFTKCNQAVNFVGRTFNAALEGLGMSAIGGDVVNGNSLANDIGAGLANSGATSFDKTKYSSAQATAEEGAFVVGFAPGHVLSLTTGKFEMTRYKNGIAEPFTYPQGKVANVNGSTTTGLGPNKNNSYGDTRYSYANIFYLLYKFP